MDKGEKMKLDFNLVLELVAIWSCVLIFLKLILNRIISFLKIPAIFRKTTIRFAKIIILFSGIIASVNLLGLKEAVPSALALSGILGLIFGISLNDWISNLIGGIFLAISDDYNIGDKVIILGNTYEILEISTTYTKLKDKKGIHFMPNSIITNIFGWVLKK